MKKLIIFLFIFIIMCGFKPNRELTIVKEKKKLFSYSLPYINHDDVILSTTYKEKATFKVEETKEEVVEDITEEETIPVITEAVEEPVKEDIVTTTPTTTTTKINTTEEQKREVVKKSGYYAPNGNYLGEKNAKVIDVSYYQKTIDWDAFYNSGKYYGVILRLGFYTTLDKSFERNLSELKRLNIPYGIYLFSYATSINGARAEAEFTNNMIDKYDIKPTLGIYYDLESWSTSTLTTDNITKNGYNYIAKGYIESVKSHVNNNYTVGIYSGRWYAMNRLGKIAKSYVLWVAEYNKTCKYDEHYIMWQYTSKGSVPGINGYVDISYLF